MLQLKNAEFIYDPYPIGLVREVFQKSHYKQLVDSFPSRNKFIFMESLGKKYSLSELNNPTAFHKHIASHKPWNEFYQWIKSKDFVVKTLESLRNYNVDLGIYDFAIYEKTKLLKIKDHLRLISESYRGNDLKSQIRLSARFEFSMLPADGGHIKPHTDSPRKIITLVIPMIKEGEWNPAWGGGTEVMKPKDITKNFNFMNQQLEFDEVNTIKTFDFLPNQCTIFLKTFNSLHAVRPMKGYHSDYMRPTLTINIEKMS